MDITLRPIRFGFLANPDNIEHLSKIFHANTCLWGGMYNPIIPFFREVPDWWDADNDNKQQIIDGYINFFEPDFIIEAEKGMAHQLGYDSKADHTKRVLTFEDIMISPNDEEYYQKYGLNVNELYLNLYKKEFQFSKRHPSKIVDVQSDDTMFKNFIACTFGAFPSNANLLKQNYQEAFSPEIIDLKAQSLLKLYQSNYESSLEIGSRYFDTYIKERFELPKLFIMDVNQPNDLFDFWNLRAIYKDVIAIPLQWIDILADFYNNFIQENYRPLPGNPNGVMIRTHLHFSRSITREKMEQLYQNHFKANNNATVRTNHYPAIWIDFPHYMSKPERPTLQAKNKVIDVSTELDESFISFNIISPDFATKSANKYRWANVITLNDWGDRNHIANAFPCDNKNISFLKFGTHGDDILSTTDGLVVFPDYKSRQSWKFFDRNNTLNKWLKSYNIESSLSDAGKKTEQIIKTLGDFGAVHRIANKEIIELLNEISEKPEKIMQQKEFCNKIDGAVRKNLFYSKNSEIIVNKKIVELGIEVKCNKCDNKEWYSLKQLDYLLECHFCLKTFTFPIIDTTKSAKWAYRLVGPFALSNYAEGGYATALSISFFANSLLRSYDTKITWFAGHNLTLPTGQNIEVDFILWSHYQNTFGSSDATEIIFGEAKSFAEQAFEQKDIDNMKLLAKNFPECILVFATMKEDLSDEEKNRFRELVQWSESYNKNNQQANVSVIILTGTELFVDFNLQNTWENKGGKHKEIIETHKYGISNNLKYFAKCTQELYLDIPSDN